MTDRQLALIALLRDDDAARVGKVSLGRVQSVLHGDPVRFYRIPRLAMAFWCHTRIDQANDKLLEIR